MPLTPVSMALTDQDKIKNTQPWDERKPEEVSDYPYNLEIHLTPRELRKLGMNTTGLKPGAKVRIVGTGAVESASSEMVNGIAEHSATIQIQTLGLEEVNEEAENRATTMFGEQT